jgi:hypothetical protein
MQSCKRFLDPAHIFWRRRGEQPQTRDHRREAGKNAIKDCCLKSIQDSVSVNCIYSFHGHTTPPLNDVGCLCVLCSLSFLLWILHRMHSVHSLHRVHPLDSVLQEYVHNRALFNSYLRMCSQCMIVVQYV